MYEWLTIEAEANEIEKRADKYSLKSDVENIMKEMQKLHDCVNEYEYALNSCGLTVKKIWIRTKEKENEPWDYFQELEIL